MYCIPQNKTKLVTRPPEKSLAEGAQLCHSPGLCLQGIAPHGWQVGRGSDRPPGLMLGSLPLRQLSTPGRGPGGQV